jgi:hypothetical protein
MNNCPVSIRLLRPLALAGLLCAGSAPAQTLLSTAGQQGAASQALLAQGRPDDAMRSLEAQVGTNPFDAVSMNNLAAVKASRQDWYGAADLLVRAHRLAPDNSVISGNLDQLNSYLAKRMAPAKSAAVPGLAQGAIWPEPPALWQSAVSAGISAAPPSARRTQDKKPAFGG